jgi:hypothetical protein
MGFTADREQSKVPEGNRAKFSAEGRSTQRKSGHGISLRFSSATKQLNYIT